MSGHSSGRYSARDTPSPHNVIPPIISNERDRDFLVNLNSHIDKELCKIDRHNPEQRYIVYKGAFDRIIDYVTAYKPLLTAIKAEYEDCIETIQRGQREAFFLSGKLKAMASEPSTIRNYRKRGDELEYKMGVIESDNKRLKKQLDDLRAAREEKERKAKEVAEPIVKVVKKDKRAIPGLSLHQSTDTKTLTRELEKLERQFKELSLSHRTRYSTKDQQEQLKDQLSFKVALRDDLSETTEQLKTKRENLKVAVEAANSYMKLQPIDQSIGDSVMKALNNVKQQLDGEKEPGMQNTPNTTAFEEDDPTREKEAELMLEYIEKFNELLEDRKYEEAAIHAANSPKGILRTPETLHRFKDLKGVTTSSGRTPLLAFCDGLMSSVLAFGVKPSDYMSVECVKCALEENRLDLLSHWIAQDRLTNSEQLGNMIYNYTKVRPASQPQYLSLAQQVYVKIEDHVSAMICMVKQGRVNQALEYAKANRMSPQQLTEVLRVCPTNTQLVHGLYEVRTGNSKSLCPLGAIVTTLLKTDDYDVGLGLIKDIYSRGPKDVSLEASPLRNAVFDDHITTSEQWVDIVQKCQETGYAAESIDILAAVTVLGAVKNSSTHVADIEKQAKEVERVEEEKQAKKASKREAREARKARLKASSLEKVANEDSEFSDPSKSTEIEIKETPSQIRTASSESDVDTDTSASVRQGRKPNKKRNRVKVENLYDDDTD